MIEEKGGKEGEGGRGRMRGIGYHEQIYTMGEIKRVNGIGGRGRVGGKNINKCIK